LWSKLPLADKTVLDFGCGISSPFRARWDREKPRDSQYFGYDIDERAVKALGERRAFYDFFSDDSLRGRFDLVYADNIYEHLSMPEREEFAKRAYELLRTGGTLVVLFPHIANLNIIEHFLRDRTHLTVSREHEAAFLESFGFGAQVHVAGMTFPYRSVLFSVKQALRNMVLGYLPQTTVVLIATKDR
jgi:SAM-dependent methyltransferase